jgi:exopolysaccharide biosynthesis polyprenyl glycosylphosphotransferase
VVEAVAVLSVFVYFTQSFLVSRAWVALLAILSLVVLSAERLVLRRALERERGQGRLRRPVILVSREGEEALEAAAAAIPDFSVVSHVRRGKLPAQWVGGSELTGGDLVVAAADFDEDELWRLIVEAGHAGRTVFLYSPVRSVHRDRLSVREVGGRALVKVAPPYLRGVRAFQKRTFDILAASLLFIVALPLMALIGLAVVVTSGRPALYSGDRLGKDGKIFTMWKFRTMRDRQVAPPTKPDDPRRTRLGSFLRRSSLDELPQLWNVITGDMSLVGPRPFPVAETEQPAFAKRFDRKMGWFDYRYRTRPGITGWAQVHGLRGQTRLDPWVEHDNWYIENWSLMLDIRILLRTVLEVVRGRNAY